jgi:Mrp family chromosome partitioning ATPase
MTALDRAFVKAYLPQRHLIRRGSAAKAEALPEAHARSASAEPSPPPHVRTANIAAATAAPPAPIVAAPAPQRLEPLRPGPQPSPAAAAFCEPEVIEPTFTLQLAPVEEPVLAELVIEPAVDAESIVHRIDLPATATETSMVESNSILSTATMMHSPATMQPLSAFAPSGDVEEQFHARLEVDRFDWPDAVSRLSESAARELGGFVEQLAARSYRGERLFNLMGMHRGVGCTTVLLAAARELSRRRLRTAIVDAKFSGPILAPRLGIAAGGGWEQVCSGSASLEEIMISSVDDAVTLVPLADSSSPAMLKLGGLHVSVMFGLLRDHFDIVLVDAGTMDELGDACQISTCGTTAQPDGVFLVYDRRSTQEATIAEACRRLAAVRMDVLGRVENFAQRELPTPKLSIVG